MTIKEEQDLVATIISQTKRINDLEDKVKQLAYAISQLQSNQAIHVR